MNNKSRTDKAIFNSLIGISTYIFIMVSTIATRIVFARYLGRELLGLNSLYTSVLQILQISELGISNAIIIFLYEPIKVGNKEKVKSLINIYKKVYNIFALLLLLLGTIVLFFVIPAIVSVNTIDMKTVQVYFFLFLLGIVCSYLFAYNKSVFYAEQRNGLISSVNAAQKVIVGILQVFAVFYAKNYYIYLILFIIGNLAENLICHFMALKNHPYLKDHNYQPLSRQEKKDIVGLIKPIFVVKIADKVLNQSDSLIINQFINIITLGMYTNYNTIINACLGLFSPIGAALTSGYGNLAVGASSSEKYEGYRKSYEMLHWVSVILCCFFLALIQNFIYIAYGEEYLLTDRLSILMTIYLYVVLIKTIYYSYQNAMGLHRLDQKQMVLQVPFNIISSIIFVKLLGIDGVILGTILSIVIFSLCFKGKYLYQYSFGMKSLKYFFKTFKDALLASLVFAFTFFVSEKFVAKTLVCFALKTIVLGVFIVTTSFMLFSISADFRYSLKIMISKAKSRLNH